MARVVLQGVAELAARFDDFLVDLWGVIHDGEAPYEGVVDALERLAALGDKRVLFVTNTSRSAAAVIATLESLGIRRDLFFDVVSSGDVTRDALAARDPAVFASLPTDPRCFHHGDASFVPWLFELGLTMTDEIDACDLVIASGAPHDEPRLSEGRTLLATAAARDVPLVCTNPDRVIPKGEGALLGPGAVAAAYRELGGRAFLYGKPHAPIYDEAKRRLFTSEHRRPRRVVAIGDLLETDIAGARGAALPSVLVTRGAHVADPPSPAPDMILARFRW